MIDMKFLFRGPSSQDQWRQDSRGQYMSNSTTASSTPLTMLYIAPTGLPFLARHTSETTFASVLIIKTRLPFAAAMWSGRGET
mgnify:CR=1 FL=1